MKLGMIGAGLVAEVYHIPSFQCCPGVEISAVCDVVRTRAETLAEKVGGATVYTDYHNLLARADVDAVSICTRTDTHADIAIAAARAGKHIFLEKPMALNEAQSHAILEAVKENGVIFMLGMLNRFRTEAQILDERRQSGRMGEIYHADARWIRRRGVPANDWFKQKALSGGGAGLDIGVHAIDLAWYLMGCPKPLTVSGVAHRRLGNPATQGTSGWGPGSVGGVRMDTEEAAVAFVRFEGGRTMTVMVSWAINGADEDLNLHLYGTKEGADLSPFVIYGEENGYCADITPQFVREDAWKEAFNREIAYFVNCVATGTQPTSAAEAGHTVQRIIEAIYRSDETQAEVQF